MGRTHALLLTGIASTLSIAYAGSEARPRIRIFWNAPAVVRILPAASAHLAAAVNPELRTPPASPLDSARDKLRPAEAGEGWNSGFRTRAEPGRSIPDSDLLPVVNQPDIRAGDREILNDILMWLPALCRDNLRHLVMRYTENVERGQSSSSVMLIRGNMTAGETVAIIAHECGHIVSLGALRGAPRDGVSAFPDGSVPTYNGPASSFYSISWKSTARRRSDAGMEDFVSGYALEDPFEDFAESFVMYALQNAEFRRIAQGNAAIARKYAFMRGVVFGPDFQPAPSRTLLWKGGGRIWDITKLPHQLTL